MDRLNTTVTATAPIFRGPGIGPRHNVVGATHCYKLLPEETGGALAVWEVELEPGAGAPPHRHAEEEEAFYVVAGMVTISADDSAPERLGPGSFFFAPRNSSHVFRNEGPDYAKLLVLASPAANLVAMFGRMDAAANGAGGIAPLEEIVGIAARHGVAILPPG